jgi:cysteine desulfurase family protein
MAIYLDNAATSHPKPEEVYRAADRALRELGASPGRGSYRAAIEASRLLFETRLAAARLFGISDAARIVFTASATEALNLALFGLLNPGDRVVTTSMEHNAVLRPLELLRRKGVEVVKVSANRDGFVEPIELKNACTQKTRLLALSHCSNVSGTRQAVEEIGPWCRKQGILLLVDGAQSAGLFDIDVETMAIDLLAVPGHKGLFGPPGTGLLYVRESLQLRPLLVGGTGGDSALPLPPPQLPEGLESGTANTPGLAGLKAGIEFLLTTGIDTVRNHELNLVRILREQLPTIPGLVLHGAAAIDYQGSALSFTIAGQDPAAIAFRLDRNYDIQTRAGLHCAPDAHRSIGTFPQGTVRISPGWFNSQQHIEHLLCALSGLAKGSHLLR